LLFIRDPDGYDLESFAVVLQMLRDNPWHVYDLVRWPYPPGFFPWIIVSAKLSAAPVLSFSQLIRIPAIVADLGLAAGTFAYLQARRCPTARLLLATGIMAVGPTFFIVSAFHGQIDSVAILPALISVLLWEREVPRRALLCGLLIGLGAAIKSVPILMLLALLPTARSWRERFAVVTVAAAVLAVAVLPFLAADAPRVVRALAYSGGPGFGGLSLLVQPGLAVNLIAGGTREPRTAATQWLLHAGPFIALAALVLVTVLLLRRRTRPVEAATLLWLTIYVAAPNFFFQYLVWGIPFFVAAGHLWKVVALEAAVLAPHLLAELRPQPVFLVESVYIPVMILVWLALALVLVWAVIKVPVRGPMLTGS
jgi:hypothetical protein